MLATTTAEQNLMVKEEIGDGGNSQYHGSHSQASKTETEQDAVSDA